MRTPMRDVGSPDTGRAAPERPTEPALDRSALGGLACQLWRSSSQPA